MSDLEQIIATPKTGKEFLTDNGQSTNYTLLDFWRWSVSDLLSNATRGRLAEFIVGSAIGLNPANLRDEWDAYDLIADDGIKIEVKSAAYIQSWNQKRFSRISFSIKPARSWETEPSNQRGEPKRHADIYVFCHLKHKDQSTIDPLKMEQWDFYVVPTDRLDSYKRGRNSISLNTLKKMSSLCLYGELKSQIKMLARERHTSM